MKHYSHKKGMSQVAMLLIFIAAVFFAVLAISNLVSFSDRLGGKTSSVQDAALDTAASSLTITSITGYSLDSNSSDMEGIIITATPDTGQVDLKDGIIYIQVGNRTARLKVVNGTTQHDRISGFHTD